MDNLTQTTKRVHPVVYILVSNKYATYYELKYNYSLEELVDLYEMCMLQIYNRTTILEEGNKK